MNRTASAVLAFMLFAGVALATDQISGSVSRQDQPVSGRNQSGQSMPLCVTDAGALCPHSVNSTSTGPDGGAVPVEGGASVASGLYEICVSSTYDGGAILDSGFLGIGSGTGIGRETYSVVVLPAGTRGWSACNASTATQVNVAWGARSAAVPIIGGVGTILESRGAGTGAYLSCISRNSTDTAAAEIHFSSVSNMTSGQDGGTNCVRGEVWK